MSADSVVKHLRTEDKMEDLIEFQVAVGSPWTILSRAGSFLQDLQTLWRRFRARIIVESSVRDEEDSKYIPGKDYQGIILRS